MNGLRHSVSLFFLSASLLSCGTSHEAKAAPCSPIGQRFYEQPVRGYIFGDAGAKIDVRACPKLSVSFAFIGSEPEEYRRLRRLAEEREDVLFFNAKAEGYVVTNGPGSYMLLLSSLYQVREDAGVAKRVGTARGYRPQPPP